MSIFRHVAFCLAYHVSVEMGTDRIALRLDLVALPLIAYGAIRVRVTAANLEGEAEWTSLLGHRALCRSCGL